ncbi:MAG: WYL domain-containing protein [Clostridium septicum]|uniref:WYL domain-containing protein n=1 Tax=Clostridium septicum TaxID=1504 RepID=UPI00258DEDF4|nr:WYL domain-containing protein [Clostridium septicum]MDU1314238.1 WYL domain-containing protein [Clostridium septicum]
MNKNVSNNSVYNAVIDILREHTNEDNTLTIAEINIFLKEKLGVTKDRHTITSYINKAMESDHDIIKIQGHKNKYYINTPILEEYEIKFIVDCLSANKCITHKKTMELEKKLCNFIDKKTRENIYKSALVENRSKTRNEEIFYNIDKITKAINIHSKIQFNYVGLNENRKLIAKMKDGYKRIYKAIPLHLHIKNENYYLMLIIESKNTIAFYRVDRMVNVEVLEEKINYEDYIEDYDNFNPIDYCSKCFKMYTGDKEIKVRLLIEKWMINFLIDELGDSVKIFRLESGKHIAEFNVFYSKGLVGWILGLGTSAKVIGPKVLKEKVLEELKEISKSYMEEDLNIDESIWR